MKRACHCVLLAVLAAEALIVGQGPEVKKVLADVRAALGGDANLELRRRNRFRGASLERGEFGEQVDGTGGRAGGGVVDDVRRRPIGGDRAKHA